MTDLYRTKGPGEELKSGWGRGKSNFITGLLKHLSNSEESNEPKKDLIELMEAYWGKPLAEWQKEHLNNPPHVVCELSRRRGRREIIKRIQEKIKATDKPFIILEESESLKVCTEDLLNNKLWRRPQTPTRPPKG